MLSAFAEAILFLLFCFATEEARVGDSEYWDQDKGHSSVLYAEVLDVVPATPHDHSRIQLRPLATLTGKFDSARQGDVLTDAQILDTFGVYIRKPPQIGAKVVVLVQEEPENRERLRYRIPNAKVECFPTAQDRPAPIGDRRPPLFEVTGFDDPKVTETIENLRKLRGKHREEAEKNAAAKPAAGSATPPAPPARVAPLVPAVPTSPAPTPAAPKR